MADVARLEFEDHTLVIRRSNVVGYSVIEDEQEVKVHTDPQGTFTRKFEDEEKYERFKEKVHSIVIREGKSYRLEKA